MCSHVDKGLTAVEELDESEVAVCRIARFAERQVISFYASSSTVIAQTSFLTLHTKGCIAKFLQPGATNFVMLAGKFPGLEKPAELQILSELVIF